MTGAEDSLQQYLREIGRYPLVDREEEARLAKRIRDGEEQALQTLVCSNLRFVVSVSKKYQNQGLPLADLISEGNVGLVRAARRFDETRGTKFITYAVWWIRQAILQALAEHGRVVRIPLNKAGSVRRIARQSMALRQELGREPTVSEVADAVGMRRGDVEQGLAIAWAHLSLDAPSGSDEDTHLKDFLPDKVSPKPDDEAYARALSDSFNAALATLHEREATTIRLYFGLGGRQPMSLAAIGRELGVTRERARQIKGKAMARLRHASRIRTLESFRE